VISVLNVAVEFLMAVLKGQECEMVFLLVRSHVGRLLRIEKRFGLGQLIA